jgi:hypothetical protein
MDGYSVEEAAEVLGVSQGRVWELIARGVLVGASEGRADMRVFLRPITPPQRFEADPPLSPPAGPPGNGGTHVEASPFRELLTEFRNLTERYGQALLALGEARGEVAALRSRVDLLEARMDMRLPLRPASTVAWELSERPARAPETAEQPHDAGAPPQPAETVAARPEAVAEPEAAAPPEAVVPPEPEASTPPEAAAEPEPAVRPGAVASPEPEAASSPEPGPMPQADTVTGEPAEVDSHAPPAAPEVPAADVPGAPEVAVRVELPEPPAVPDGRDPHGESAQRPEPKRRISGGRAAVAGLAEALARAEDPTLADLPGARDAAEALAAFRRDARTAEAEAVGATTEQATAPGAPEEHEMPEPPEQSEAPETQAEGQRVEPAPEPAPAAAAATDSPYTTEVVEPDWFADGDFMWLDAGDAEARAGGVPETTESDEVAPEAAHLEREDEAPAADRIQNAFAEPEPEGHPEPEGSAEAEHLEHEEEAPAVEAIQDAFEEQGAPGAEHAASEAAWPPEDRSAITEAPTVGFGLFRGQATSASAPAAPVLSSEPVKDEEPLLWFGDEFEAAQLEVAAEGWRDQEHPAEGAVPATPPADPAPATAVSDEDLERVAADEGWDGSEVDAIRSYLDRTSGRVADEPPADEPPADEAVSAAPHAVEPSELSTAESAEPARSSQPVAPDQDWLRGRRGTAAGAYRRLRRLFDS